MLTKEEFEKELQEVSSRKFAYIERMTKLGEKEIEEYVQKIR